MVIIMDMDTGRYVAGEFGAFEEEVLNAEWLPPPFGLLAGLQESTREHRSRDDAAVDPDAFAEAFLRGIYQSQE